jgi:hypothetical protein
MDKRRNTYRVLVEKPEGKHLKMYKGLPVTIAGTNVL